MIFYILINKIPMMLTSCVHLISRDLDLVLTKHVVQNGLLPKLYGHETSMHLKSYLTIGENTFDLLKCAHRVFEIRRIDLNNYYNFPFKLYT